MSTDTTYDGITESTIRDSIERAVSHVGRAWPLHSFVTANPLAGFEDRPFHEAVDAGERLFGGRGYPSPAVFRQAWERGAIDAETLTQTLSEHGYDEAPELLLDRMEEPTEEEPTEEEPGDETPTDRVDRVLAKWLAAFLDEGRSDWSMPNREDGFYAAFRTVARHDDEIPGREGIAELPTDPVETISSLLPAYPPDQWAAIFEYQFAALPGWSGLIRQRIESGGEWQSTYPITLAGYLAARLVLTDRFDAPVAPPENDTAEGTDLDASSETAGDDVPLAELWLDAWEATYREELVEAVAAAGESGAGAEVDDARPDAQLVFCIDTRSEIIRRHLEATGDYETFGYAGFFGVPMRYEGYDASVAVDACPPILDVEHRITERPTDGHDHQRASHDSWAALQDTGRDLVKTLKSNAATAFSFVEVSGSGYGLALAARTLRPARVAGLLHRVTDRVPDTHEFCEPSVEYNPDAVTALREGLTLDEKVSYAATAFELMGMETFARLVVFTGHGGQTANNPFESSLDCGACAGNPGGPNARVLAAICNDEAVRDALGERGFDIPDDTVFVAAEHTTTTDEVTLYTGPVPESHAADVERLSADLETARVEATAERAEAMAADADGVHETERRAADWAETRPEWGLAGNAAFVVGPRDLTAGLDLDGRSFLHSYDPSTDPDGDALEAVLTGPMVVTQWINSQYYFATVDNGTYGSGSKITQNPVGNVGVYQGNGGDLRTGLPLQSVMAADDEPYHQPMRLSTVVYAPVERVTSALAGHDHLIDLLDNGWLSLTVVDPEQEHSAFRYDGDLTWTPTHPDTASTVDPEAVAPPTADD